MRGSSCGWMAANNGGWLAAKARSSGGGGKGSVASHFLGKTKHLSMLAFEGWKACVACLRITRALARTVSSLD